jgi:hypothetical protein
MSFQSSIINDSFFSGDVSSVLGPALDPSLGPASVLRTPERRPTLPAQNAPARPILNTSEPPIHVESVDIDPINNRLIFDDALVPIEPPVTNDNQENDLDYSDDDHDDHDDDHDYLHYCGDRTCYGDCGVLSCGCIDTCRRHCEDDGDYDDYDDY